MCVHVEGGGVHVFRTAQRLFSDNIKYHRNTIGSNEFIILSPFLYYMLLLITSIISVNATCHY